MKTFITAVSISGNLREKLEAIAAAGNDGIEILEKACKGTAPCLL